jgi:hypothetical protein
MDILNFISWIKGKRQVTTVDPAKTLLPVGLKDPRRDDEYLAGAISVADFITQLSTIVPSTVNAGLYSQTVSSIPITNTALESDLITTGVGSLTVPANGFKVGDSFNAKLIGHLSCNGSATIRFRIKAGTTILADTGVIAMSTSTNKHWEMDISFTVRTLGAAGVASIASGGIFSYIKNAGTNFEGVDFSIINNTTFDTTTNNTLKITAEWGAASTANSIYSEIFILNKTY